VKRASVKVGISIRASKIWSVHDLGRHGRNPVADTFAVNTEEIQSSSVFSKKALPTFLVIVVDGHRRSCAISKPPSKEIEIS
jgi:hypothetical protein